MILGLSTLVLKNLIESNLNMKLVVTALFGIVSTVEVQHHETFLDSFLTSDYY